MLETIGLILIALLVLSLLVVVHEFGHFIAAKMVGVWPEEFGIGLPPRVWGKKIGETIWSINALPLGGFVRLHGEVSENGMTKPERSFIHKGKIARGFIAVAGVFMNMVFAVVAFSFIFFVGGIPNGIVANDVSVGSPAELAGVKPNDVILAIDGRPLYNPSFFGQTVTSHAGRLISMTFKDVQTNEVITKEFELRSVAPEKQGLLGISYNYSPAGYLPVTGVSKFFTSIQYGFYQTYDFTVLILNEFGKMFSQLFLGQVPKGLTGPLGVVGVTAQAAKQGFLDLVGFAALISINLAIINLVPFPPLDGSRVVFLFIERVVGRKRLPKIEEKVQTFGLYFVFGIVLLLTIREVPKLFFAGSLEGFVQSLIQ